jgi:carotenoid 1,2-hydratase
MTERSRAALERDARMLRIGPSHIRQDGTETVFDVDEICTPLPRRIRGHVRVRPELPAGQRFSLDPTGRHGWQALAPRARIEVDLQRPELRWSGWGYLDTNDGEVPLERDFHSWEWARAATPTGASVVYDVRLRDGTRGSLAHRFGPEGTSACDPPPAFSAPATSLWRIPRPARGEGQATIRTIEDTPFYARSTLQAVWDGHRVDAMHESLRLDRFTTPIVQAMLPFRMPRRNF